MYQQIVNRDNGDVLFEGDYVDKRDCVLGALDKGIHMPRANLRQECLCHLDFSYLNLTHADFTGSNIICALFTGAKLFNTCFVGAILAQDVRAISGPVRRATRADGFEFFLWPTDAGWRVMAGCRFFDMNKAWRHWEMTRGNTARGDESLDILTMFELHIQRVGECK